MKLMTDPLRGGGIGAFHGQTDIELTPFIVSLIGDQFSCSIQLED